MGSGAVRICQDCHRTDAFGPIKHDEKWHKGIEDYKAKQAKEKLKRIHARLAGFKAWETMKKNKKGVKKRNPSK